MVAAEGGLETSPSNSASLNAGLHLTPRSVLGCEDHAEGSMSGSNGGQPALASSFTELLRLGSVADQQSTVFSADQGTFAGYSCRSCAATIAVGVHLD